MHHVDGRAAGAAHVVVGVERGVHGEGLDGVAAEPVGDLADGGAFGVVKVLAGGEELNALGASALEGVEQAWVQAACVKRRGSRWL